MDAIFYQSLTDALPFFLSAPAQAVEVIEYHSPSSGTLISATVSLDAVTTMMMCSLLDAQFPLGKLFLLPPIDTVAFMEKQSEIWDTLWWFFYQGSDFIYLEHVALSLDLLEAGVAIKMLRGLPGLRHLELIAPSIIPFDSQPEHSQTEVVNSVIHVVERSRQLQQLTIPTQIVAASPRLARTVDRVFDLAISTSASTVRYSHAA